MTGTGADFGSGAGGALLMGAAVHQQRQEALVTTQHNEYSVCTNLEVVALGVVAEESVQP